MQITRNHAGEVYGVLVYILQKRVCLFVGKLLLTIGLRGLTRYFVFGAGGGESLLFVLYRLVGVVFKYSN